MAARRAALPTALLRRAVVPAPIFRASRCAAAALGAQPVLQTGRTVAVPAAVAGRARWYSAGSEKQVPGSRIWGFEEIKKLVESGKGGEDGVVLVDVREPGELLQTGKIPGAINIPITSAAQSFHISEADFEDHHGFERPSKDAALLFYCKAGIRAKSAAALAQHAGWATVGEYPGSWIDWEAKGGPVEPVGHNSGKTGGR